MHIEVSEAASCGDHQEATALGSRPVLSSVDGPLPWPCRGATWWAQLSFLEQRGQLQATLLWDKLMVEESAAEWSEDPLPLVKKWESSNIDIRWDHGVLSEGCDLHGHTGSLWHPQEPHCWFPGVASYLWGAGRVKTNTGGYGGNFCSKAATHANEPS